MFGKKALEKLRTKRCSGKKPWKNYARKNGLKKNTPKNYAQNDVLGKNLGKTTHETMFWEKTLEKLRTKRCSGKKPWKNYARKDGLKKIPRKTKRRAVLSPKEAFSQRSISAPPIRIPSMMREVNRG